MRILSDLDVSGRVRALFRAVDLAGEAGATNTGRSPRAQNMTPLTQEVGMSLVGLNEALSGQGNPAGNPSEKHQSSCWAQGIYQAIGLGGWLVAGLLGMGLAADVFSLSMPQDRRRGRFPGRWEGSWVLRLP